MILADTSVWVDFLRHRSPVEKEMRLLLKEKRIVASESVFAELMYGVQKEKERIILETYWQTLPRSEFRMGWMFDAASRAMKNDFLQKGIGLLDAMIIHEIIVHKHLFWTLDKKIIKHLDPEYLYK